MASLPLFSIHEAEAHETSSKELLAGPKVDEAASSETNARFGGPGRGRGRVTVPIRQWFAELPKLDLSESQVVPIREIVKTFQQTAQKHQRTNGPRLRQLQREVQKARLEEGDVSPKIRRELGELRAKAPKPTEAQLRIWKLLSQPQQEQMRHSLAELRNRIAAERLARRREVAMNEQDAPPQRPRILPNNQSQSGRSTEPNG